MKELETQYVAPFDTNVNICNFLHSLGLEKDEDINSAIMIINNSKLLGAPQDQIGDTIKRWLKARSEFSIVHHQKVGTRLKLERQRLGKSLYEFGEVTGSNPIHITLLELTDFRLDVEFLMCLNQAGVDIYYVLTGNKLKDVEVSQADILTLLMTYDVRAKPDNETLGEMIHFNYYSLLENGDSVTKDDELRMRVSNLVAERIKKGQSSLFKVLSNLFFGRQFNRKST